MNKKTNHKKNIRNLSYMIVNIVLILIVLWLFNHDYLTELYCFKQFNTSLILFLFVVIFVHMIKALRLYIAFYGTDISNIEYIKTYCKVTPVSILLPFKFGEIFRIYSYGYLIDNYLKSTVIILLDRFMDTVALLSIMVFLATMNGNSLRFFVYLLIIFTLILFFLYKVFPSIYRYWKDYFLQGKATKNHLWCLDKLEILNKLYTEITEIIKGRGIILYLLSIFVWLTELSNLIIIKEKVVASTNENILAYLLSALELTKSAEMNKFIAISVALLIVVYLMIKFIELVKRKRAVNNENYCDL